MAPRSCALVVVLAGGILVVGGSAATADASAQGTETVAEGPGAPDLLPGRMVRVSWSSPGDDDDTDLEGTLVDTDQLFLRVRRGARVVTIPRLAIRQLEVAKGQGRAWKWLPIGTGSGFALGAVLCFADMLASGCTFTSCREPTTGEEINHRIAARMGIGVAVGVAAGVGLTFSRHRPTRWTEVPAERIHVSVMPVVGRGGYGLTLAVAF